MTIRYTMTMEDYREFFLYRRKEEAELARARAAASRKRALIPVLACVVFIAVYIGLSNNHRMIFASMLAGACLALLGIFWYGRRILSRAGVGKWFPRMFEHARNIGLFDVRELTLTSERIIETTTARRREIEWRAIEKIVTTDHHLFIYDTAVSALVIPRRDFSSDDAFWQFVRQAREYHGDSAGPIVAAPATGFEVLPKART